MLIRLDVDYVSNYLFWPVYSLKGRLVAAEMVCRFNNAAANLSMPADIMFTLLNNTQRYDFIQEQISFIHHKANWFIENNTLLLLRVDPVLVDMFMQVETLCHALRGCPFIRLEVNEHFPGLSQGKENAALDRMSQAFPLWLDNVGSGKNHLQALHDGLLSGIKLDQDFVANLLSRPENQRIIDPLLSIIKRHYQGVSIIVKGVGDSEYFQNVKQLNIDAVQGDLWPAVHFDALRKKIDLP